MITWVIGARGLLGSHLSQRSPNLYEPGPVPWANPGRAADVLHDQARRLHELAADGPWRVLWAAGAATTATAPHEAIRELEPLEGLLRGLRGALPRGPGCFFLTSSAGGVYAGSSGAPFRANSPTHPLGAYGELKLAQEALALSELGSVIPVLVGRLSNLYGPGQDLHKHQGLISRLALAATTHQPINIFVPLDTLRDYIYADDAAEVILRITSDPGNSVTSDPVIIATGQGSTVAQLIATMGRVAKRRIPVALGTDSSARLQAVDLRLVPTHVPLDTTPLEAGMKAVYLDLVSRLQVTAS